MNQTDIVNAATQAAQQSKTILGRQVDRQAAALGSTLAQTARDLQQVGSNLRDSGTIGSAAQVADWAADYVSRAADYLNNGHTDRFLVDIEEFARQRPWAVAASAAVVGFAAARVVKSASVRRYAETNYGTSDYGQGGSSAGYAGSAYRNGVTTSAGAGTTPVVADMTP